ncbi:MAG: LPS export ABC transporter permease LptG [Tatlockia sp.]|nr:LPS export ABC transporter permease LptG [Tatlockia sp.]
MKLLDAYIARTILSSIALVTLVLVGLQIFILFVSQINDLGKADFNFMQVAFFVMLQMPYQVYLFIPLASLLGCLIGLGVLANNRELIIMRAAGMSIGQVSLAVLKAAMIVVFLVTLLGETLVPRLTHYANDRKTQALSSGQALRTPRGLWLREGNDFIVTYIILPGGGLRSVAHFRFDALHKLRIARQIIQVDYVSNQWIARGVRETIINDDHTETRDIPEMIWDVKVKPKILRVSSSEPDEMNLHQLHQFLRAQKLSHRNAFQYQLSFWQRIIQPLTTIVMMLLAIPFIFGPLRSSTMGSKLLAGATVGFGFYIMNKFFGPVSLILQLPPEIAAIGPTLLFGLLAIFLMTKTR